MNERWDDFDCTLATSLSEMPPPEDVIREATPFHDAIRRTVMGLILTTFTLNLWYFQYILPSIGTILIYLGFRTLRNNNRWFKLAWGLGIFRLLSLFFRTVLWATPYAPQFLGVPSTILSTASVLGMCLCLHFGLTMSAGEVGQSPAHRPALAAAVWYGVLILVALLAPGAGWLAVIPMAAAYVLIIRSLLRVSEDLEDWGYGVRAAPVRVSGGRLLALYLGLLAAAVLACAVWSNHPPVEGAPLPETVSAKTEAVQERLIGLGFPEELLSRLPAEEILRLETARSCTVSAGDDEDPIGSKSGRGLVHFDTVYVQQEQTTVRVYEFFTLRKDTLQTNWRTMALLEPSSGLTADQISGAATWRDREGRLLWSGMVFETRIYRSFFGESFLPAAVFNYPFTSHSRGGYVAYTAHLPEGSQNSFGSVLRLRFTDYGCFYPYSADLGTGCYTQSYSIFDPRKIDSRP